MLWLIKFINYYTLVLPIMVSPNLRFECSNKIEKIKRCRLCKKYFEFYFSHSLEQLSTSLRATDKIIILIDHLLKNSNRFRFYLILTLHLAQKTSHMHNQILVPSLTRHTIKNVKETKLFSRLLEVCLYKCFIFIFYK